MSRTIVHAILRNRFTELEPPYPLGVLSAVFRYRFPNYTFTPNYRMGLWDGYVRLLRSNLVPTGAFLALSKKAEERAEVIFQSDDRRHTPKFKALSTATTKKIRGYQLEAVNAMVAHSNTGGLILCATGSGKTYMAGAYLSRLEGSACFVVDELTLLEQAREELSRVLGEPVGIVGRSLFEPRRITVATIQTLNLHSKKKEFMDWYSKILVLIVDEIHQALNRRNVSVISAIRPWAVFGLTATLEIQKTDVFMRAVSMAGPVIYSYPLGEGVRDKVLSKGVACRVIYNQSGLGTGYQFEYDHMVVRNARRNGVVERLAREGIRLGHRVIVLVERIKHLDIMSRRLKDIPHQVICGRRDTKDRRAAIRSMDAGELPLIIANRVFGKGIDIQSVSVIIDATATKSKNSVIQRYGRGVRLAESKAGLIYFDISDTTPKGGTANRFNEFSENRKKALVASGISIFAMSGMKPAPDIYIKALAYLTGLVRPKMA